MNIHDELLSYEETICTDQEVPFILEFFKKYGTKSTAEEIARVLVEGDKQNIFTVLTFLQQGCLFRREMTELNSFVEQFHAELPHSNVFPLLHKQLLSPDVGLRNSAVASLGKTSFPENLPSLEGVVEWYRKNSPEQVEQLLIEISWLKAFA